METTHSEQFLRQRKFLLLLPLLILPFLTLAFWALGGGKSSASVTEHTIVKPGLNTELPKAKLEDKQPDKMFLYEQARRDSVKSRSAAGEKSLSHLNFFPDRSSGLGENSDNEAGKALAAQPDRQEERIRQKVRQISLEVNREPEVSKPVKKAQPEVVASNPAFSRDIDRLESLMHAMGNSESEDPEMKQINDVMEKILDVQHPERVQQRIREVSVRNSSQVFSVKTSLDKPLVNLLEAKGPAVDTALRTFAAPVDMSSGFYGLGDELASEDPAGAAVEAIIAGDQKVVSGAGVKLQLSSDLYVNGILIPLGTTVYGSCDLAKDRLQIHINNLLIGNNILPVSLTVYDLDGMPGLRVPGAMGIEATKQASDQAVQSLQLGSLDPSLSAGIQTAKGLFSKKVKQVKIEIRAGYRLLLRDNNQQRR